MCVSVFGGYMQVQAALVYAFVIEEMDLWFKPANRHLECLRREELFYARLHAPECTTEQGVSTPDIYVYMFVSNAYPGLMKLEAKLTWTLTRNATKKAANIERSQTHLAEGDKGGKGSEGDETDTHRCHLQRRSRSRVGRSGSSSSSSNSIRFVQRALTTFDKQ